VNCPNCGTSNLDTASICVNCGKPLAGSTPHSYTPPPPPPSAATYGAPPPVVEVIPNYLIQSIVITLCCCLPLGIVAIIFAAQVNTRLAANDIVGAREASAKAKLFCWIGFGIGLAAMIIWMVFGGMAFVQGLRDGMAS
jgi:hypothetical protein